LRARSEAGANGERHQIELNVNAGLIRDGVGVLDNAGRSRHHDVMILDLMLPDVDGVEVCRRVREWSRLP
jgi:DNA-binding response OmpR family regulator